MSKSGYYAWRSRPPSKRSREDALITAKIRGIHSRSHETYGYPRVHAELRTLSVLYGRRRVAQNVWCSIQYLKKCEQDGKLLPDAPPGLCATKGKGILITRPEKRTEHEELTIGRMKRCDRTIVKSCRLFEEFAELFRSREEHNDAAKNVKAWALVQQWIEDKKKFEIPELKAFAVKPFQDVEAIVAAIVMSFSQGQT